MQEKKIRIYVGDNQGAEQAMEAMYSVKVFLTDEGKKALLTHLQKEGGKVYVD